MASQYHTASFQLPKGPPRGAQRQSSAGPPRPGQGAPAGGSSFQSQPSFNFFKVPAGVGGAPPPAGYAANGQASFPPLGRAPAEAPLQHCPSNASYASANSCASNDAQEELNLRPSLDKLKKKAPFEADPTAILANAMGSALAKGMPADWAERQARPNNPLQKTESQLVAAQAQQLALKERQRREATAKAAAARAGPSQVRVLLDNRPYSQKIFLMRHGESEANISRRDVPDPNLTSLGLSQAKSWQESIGDFEPNIVLVSPLRRAVQTACHAFEYEEVPMVFCRFAREIGWSCNENTIHSTPATMERHLGELPRGDEYQGMREALIAAADDPPDEMASLQRLKVEIARRPERNIFVVCHFGVIATLTGCRAKNGDVYECEWGYNDELNVVCRHKTPLNDQQCLCG